MKGVIVTGEHKTKQTKAGEQTYIYYRCGKYNREGHPRIRLREAELDRQVFQVFDNILVKDESIREWFGKVLRARTQQSNADRQAKNIAFDRQLTTLRSQQDRLLNLRLQDEIDDQTFAAKNTDLRDRIAEPT